MAHQIVYQHNEYSENPGYYFPDLSGWTNIKPEQVDEIKTPTEKWIEEWLDELGTV